MTRFDRRTAIAAMGAVAMLGVASGPAAAQDYPTRAITMIVPFAAGGPTDVVARLVGEQMSKTLGQPIIIENVVRSRKSCVNSLTMIARMRRRAPAITRPSTCNG